MPPTPQSRPATWAGTEVESICCDYDSYDKGYSIRIITRSGDCWDFWVDAEVGDVYPVA